MAPLSIKGAMLIKTHFLAAKNYVQSCLYLANCGYMMFYARNYQDARRIHKTSDSYKCEQDEYIESMC